MLGRLFKKTKKFKNEYEKTRDFLEEYRKENEAKWLAIEEHYAEDCKRYEQEALERDKQLEKNEKMVAEMVENTNKLIEASKKIIAESKNVLKCDNATIELENGTMITLGLGEGTIEILKSNIADLKTGECIVFRNVKYRVENIEEERQLITLKDRNGNEIVVPREVLYREYGGGL